MGPQQGQGPEICGAPLVLYLHSRSLTNVRRHSASSFDFVFGDIHSLIQRFLPAAIDVRVKMTENRKLAERITCITDLSCHVSECKQMCHV